MTRTPAGQDETSGYWPVSLDRAGNSPVEEQLWKDPTSFDLSEAALRWSLPLLSNSTASLASGIAWALHPSFCDDLLPMFPEENYNTLLGFSSRFLSCSLLRQAISDALEAWASHHKRIHFEDVTAECAKPGAVVDRKCTAAELFLTVEQNAGDVAAFVVNNLGNLDSRPVTTAGQQIRGRGLRNAQLTVSSSLCWYLDATFCYTFHDMNSNGVDGVLIMRFIFVVAYIFSICVIVVIFANGSQAVFCPRETPVNEFTTPSGKEIKTSSGRKIEANICGGKRCDGLLGILENMPLGILLFALFWLIFMPIFYYRVFKPCWDCFDFQATIAHEIGHVLGFDHPDTLKHMNLHATKRMDGSVCHEPMEHVELKLLPPKADSIMFSTTRHRGRTCLTDDDLDGLNVLYPMCGGAVEQPMCLQNGQLRGWVRLAVAVGFPFLLTVLLLLLLQCSVKLYQRRKVKRLQAVVRWEALRMESLKQKCSALRYKLTDIRKKYGVRSSRKTTTSRSKKPGYLGALSSFACTLMHAGKPTRPAHKPDNKPVFPRE
eukprot:CAMPEP_0119310510 /NCGR_PEP_ID=MMETSP1333-20130426/19610_1 /TAXON_ID=418940 /ORGANISM="Scyphosphaera apsteinii, Strain RCC1455" /LENGTH=544 /DNA_ID=CAMNT_0007314705 /DNA_START=125 /DNA_END=1759 /DNA_ORIENTATION=+